MYLAEKTIKNYVSNLLAKLGMEAAPSRRVRHETRARRSARRTAL
jgi:DNA-binding NarL/FixJ family response regulator